MEKEMRPPKVCTIHKMFMRKSVNYGVNLFYTPAVIEDAYVSNNFSQSCDRFLRSYVKMKKQHNTKMT